MCYRRRLEGRNTPFRNPLRVHPRNGDRKNGVRNRVCIGDVRSMLKLRIGFPFGENSAGFCKSMWLPGSILNFRIGSVSSIGGLIAVTLFAATVSDSQKQLEQLSDILFLGLSLQLSAEAATGSGVLAGSEDPAHGTRTK